MEEGILEIINDTGSKRKFNILFTFDSEETKKSYVVYTDYSKDENGKIRVFTSSYDPNDEKHELKPVKEENELYTINNLLKEIDKKTKNGETSNE